MHLFFSGIGGTGIGPLALIAHQAGYKVSGSDKQNSAYIEYLKSQGVTDIHIGQTEENIDKVNKKEPINWYVYSSAVEIENPDAEELKYCRDNGIKTSKRDSLLNWIITEKDLNLIAVAGTHGKSTTTAMVVWIFKNLDIPISYSVGAKISFGEMGAFDPGSSYFVYEADEFDRNFLNFSPFLSIITGVTWDHHEIYRTKEDYRDAFKQFIDQSTFSILWNLEVDELNLEEMDNIGIENINDPSINKLKLHGKYNRMDAWLAIAAVSRVAEVDISELIPIINDFPGLQRRMEEIAPNLYTDYAHTPEKIRGAMSAALEIAKEKNKDLIVVYEPLTDRRQHFMKDEYKDCFNGAKKIYWLPSYLAREDPKQTILSPSELIEKLSDPTIASPMKQDDHLLETIYQHLNNGDMVVCMNGGGGGGLDEWLRENFS